MPKRRITIQQGATYQDTFNISSGGVPINLTGATLRGQVRSDYGSDTILASFVPTIVNAATGQAALTIPATVTASIPDGRQVYDVELELPGGVVLRLYEGTAYVTPEVTR